MGLIVIISFAAGVLSVLAPCALPVIPVLFASHLGKTDHYKPLRIIISAILCIFVFTLLLKTTLSSIHVSQSTRNIISGSIVIGYATTLLLPGTRDMVRSRYLPTIHTSLYTHDKRGDILLGCSLGPIFTTCSPTYALLLSTILPVDILSGLVGLGAYVMGFGLFLYLLSLGGRSLIHKFLPFADADSRFKKILGAILLVVGAMIVSGLMKDIEAYLVQYWTGFVQLEQTLSQFLKV